MVTLKYPQKPQVSSKKRSCIASTFIDCVLLRAPNQMILIKTLRNIKEGTYCIHAWLDNAGSVFHVGKMLLNIGGNFQHVFILREHSVPRVRRYGRTMMQANLKKMKKLSSKSIPRCKIQKSHEKGGNTTFS